VRTVNTAQMITVILPPTEVDREFKIGDDNRDESDHVVVDCER